MTATTKDIRGWLLRMYEDDDITHMIVVCDTWDFNDFPVYVYKNENVHEVEQQQADSSMQRIMEVYSTKRGLEEQMSELRAFNYD